MHSIDEITPSAWMDDSGHVISAKQLHNGPSPLYPIALYTAFDLDKVRRETWEEAIEVVKGCSSPELLSRDRYVMVGPGGIIAMVANALRARATAKGGQT